MKKVIVLLSVLITFMYANSQTAGYIPRYNQKGVVENSTMYQNLSSPYNIGIGTVKPRTTLEIKNTNSSSVLSLVNEFSTSGTIKADIDFYVNGLNKPTSYPLGKVGYFIDSYGKMPGGLYFSTGNGSALKERMLITEKGHVGIGTLQPVARLDVTSAEKEIARFSSEAHSPYALLQADDNGAILAGMGGGLKFGAAGKYGEMLSYISVGIKEHEGNYSKYPESSAYVNGLDYSSIIRFYNNQLNGGGLEIASTSDRVKITNWTDASGIEISTKKPPYPSDFTMPNFNTNQLYLNNNGNVGIGTNNPTAALHVQNNNSNLSHAKFTLNSSSSSLEFKISSDRAQVINGKKGHNLEFATTNSNSGNINNAQLFLKENGNVGINTNDPTASLEIHNGILKITGPTASPQGNVRFVIDAGASTGHDFVLFQNQSGKQFFVKGNGEVYAKEVNIVVSNEFPDYVFEDDYNLLPLSELEAHIKEYKHLPKVPSASQVKENGFKLGEMDQILLEKVEELTLYIIEQQKRIDKQQKMIEDLQEKLK